ncbi:MAG: rhodanese-like domain-containing protein, partial [Solirubrobacteraceae bacterium]
MLSTRDLEDRLGSGDRGSALLEVAWGSPSADAPSVIPGAVRVDWLALLWDDTARRLATAEQLACRLGGLGIEPGTPLVVYGDPLQFGAYAAWVLHTLGYPDVALVDGGKEAWSAEGRPLAPPTSVRSDRIQIGAAPT